MANPTDKKTETEEGTKKKDEDLKIVEEEQLDNVVGGTQSFRLATQVEMFNEFE